jgi:hypothetical protein
MMASNFLSDTKGNVGLGLNKLLTQYLAFREYDSGTMVIENRDGTSVMDLLVKALNTNYINFKAPFAQVNMNPTTDSYVMFRGWNGTNYFDAARLDIGGFKILNGALCPYREYYAPAGVDYVEFTGLDINTHKCYVLVYSIYNPTTSDCIYRLGVENDYYPPDYYCQTLTVSGTTITATRSNSCDIATTSGTSSVAGQVLVLKPPNNFPKFVSICTSKNTNNIELQFSSVTTYNFTVANITKIRLFSSVSGGIGGGSRLMLLRLGG